MMLKAVLAVVLVGAASAAHHGVPIFTFLDRLGDRVRASPAVAQKVVPVLFPVIVELVDRDADGAIGMEDLDTAFDFLSAYWARFLNQTFVERGVWMGLDADGDGTVTAEEMTSVVVAPDSALFRPTMSYVFARKLDTSPQDGFMNKQEIGRLMAGRFKALMKIRKIIAYKERSGEDFSLVSTRPRVLRVGDRTTFGPIVSTTFGPDFTTGFPSTTEGFEATTEEFRTTVEASQTTTVFPTTSFFPSTTETFETTPGPLRVEDVFPDASTTTAQPISA